MFRKIVCTMSVKRQTIKKFNTFFQHFGNLFTDTIVDIYRTRFYDLLDIPIPFY